MDKISNFYCYFLNILFYHTLMLNSIAICHTAWIFNHNSVEKPKYGRIIHEIGQLLTDMPVFIRPYILCTFFNPYSAKYGNISEVLPFFPQP